LENDFSRGAAFWASQALAVPVHVSLEWPAGMPASGAARTRIQAVRAVGSGDSGAPLEAEAGPDGAVVELSDGVWWVQASAPGYWSQEAEITVAGQTPAAVKVALWPAASLHGEIVAAEGESLPTSLEVRLNAVTVPAVSQASGAQRESSPPRARLNCRISETTWSCVGPVGLFDVRLEAAGFAPRYEWGVSLKAAESTDVGRTELRRGASVFGRAVRKDGSDPPGPCRATLQPDDQRRGGAEPDAESAPADERNLSVPLSPHGYFQLVGVQPGSHVLSIACQAASGLRELRAQADDETRIDPPLQLEEQTLEIAVTPNVDPAGQPWRLTVDATAPRLRRIADKAVMSADGRWIRRGMMAGTYRVVVSSAGGTSWLQRDFNLRAGSGPLSLRLASAKVAGQVVLGTQPVRARLLFFNQAGGEPVTLNSDEDGRFHGVLPIAPDARETTWIVEAHVAQPASARRIAGVSVPALTGGAWLDLSMPTIAVRGAVHSEDGQPQRSIQVTFEESSGFRTTTSTDDAGRFEMPVLSPGRYTAVADSPEGASDRTPFEVTDGSESELSLTIHRSMRIPFYVVSNQGPVSDAAVQVWITPGVPRAFARTDQDGRFAVKLQAGTTEVGLTVGAPGYALKLIRMPVSSESDPSQNANTITLGNSSGTLVLNLQPPNRTPDPSAAFYLVHNGAIQDARTVAGWGSDQAVASVDGPAVVDAIEPGAYALCLLADPSELWQGALPSEHCRSGSVEPGGTLTLQPR
jgi:Carboxypeptidase regulatory-like domain